MIPSLRIPANRCIANGQFPVTKRLFSLTSFFRTGKVEEIAEMFTRAETRVCLVVGLVGVLVGLVEAPNFPREILPGTMDDEEAERKRVPWSKSVKRIGEI